MSDEAALLDVFFDVQRGLPRQGPGSDASTLKALALCGSVLEAPVTLDVGCGPGMQTITLARAAGGTVLAVDTAQEYLHELRVRAVAEGVSDRIAIITADMTRLPFGPESFDLIWSEGAAYIMGFENALAAWRPLLKPQGLMVVSELVWLVQKPPTEATAFFATAYPSMRDITMIQYAVRDRGYAPIAHFTLPDSDWWEHYYIPLEAKLPALRAKYNDNAAALDLIRVTEREIDIRRRFPDAYGYEFFIARRSDE